MLAERMQALRAEMTTSQTKSEPGIIRLSRVTDASGNTAYRSSDGTTYTKFEYMKLCRTHYEIIVS